MLHYARFALLAGLAVGIPAIAINPPQQNKQAQPKQESKNEKKAEPVKKDSSSKENDERLDRRNSRMKERNREIDGLLNKQK